MKKIRPIEVMSILGVFFFEFSIIFGILDFIYEVILLQFFDINYIYGLIITILVSLLILQLFYTLIFIRIINLILRIIRFFIVLFN